ncbi:MAG: glutamate racemase [Anaerolineales bacterium]|nr:glutamate racemase [Anaerolineales bacterium]MCW5856561.1 glutamate racemase [Anaerolineales bacterium]
MSTSPLPTAPIGAFDSGVGGLSVLRAIQAQLPQEHTLYVADQAHVPYGPRGLQEVRRLSEGVVEFLMGQGVKLIVIPCNTASAAALHALRAQYPGFPFVGMEPAVKPAAEHTTSGVVGVLATPTTFEGELYASVVERFGGGVTLLQDACPGLVAEIEAGRADGVEAERILRAALEPMLAWGLDTVVLGCTHYPFSFDVIRRIVGEDVRLIDPAPAIARRAAALLDAAGLRNPGPAGMTRYLTSGDPAAMQARVAELLGQQVNVEGLRWAAGQLQPVET